MIKLERKKNYWNTLPFITTYLIMLLYAFELCRLIFSCVMHHAKSSKTQVLTHS